MKLIFIGPQGSGKGTEAKRISKELEICHISTGDLLRNTQGKLKEEINSYINKGDLIPNELMLKILKEKLNSSECSKGFILDGFPRNIEQANMLDEITNIDYVVKLNISDEEAIKRISGRRVCNNCGKNYNLYTGILPKKEGVCDACGSKIVKRKDDYPEAVKKRLEIYHKKTEPVLKKYSKKLIKINGEQSVEKVQEEILNKLQN
jgi:adenylate kinase